MKGNRERIAIKQERGRNRNARLILEKIKRRDNVQALQ